MIKKYLLSCFNNKKKIFEYFVKQKGNNTFVIFFTFYENEKEFHENINLFINNYKKITTCELKEYDCFGNFILIKEYNNIHICTNIKEYKNDCIIEFELRENYEMYWI